MAGQMRRARAALAGAGVVVAVVFGVPLGGVGSAAPGAHVARRTLHVSERADLHLVRKRGSILRESGTATGTLPGSVSARFDTSNLVQVTGTVTFRPYRGGSITVRVVGYPQSTGTVAKFSGSLRIRSGMGRYANASGTGSFTGTVNRRTWRVVVNASAQMTY